jgi:hypothetical protein
MEIDCLQRNGTFKSQITLDRHNAILKLNYWPLPDPPNFSLPSTFKQTSARKHTKTETSYIIQNTISVVDLDRDRHPGFQANVFFIIYYFISIYCPKY